MAAETGFTLVTSCAQLSKTTRFVLQKTKQIFPTFANVWLVCPPLLRPSPPCWVNEDIPLDHCRQSGGTQSAGHCHSSHLHQIPGGRVGFGDGDTFL